MHHNFDYRITTKMLTDGRADGTQNLYTSASYCRVQLCKVSKLYDQNFLSYRITTSIIASRRKCWRTDERTEPRIYTLLPLIVEYNCAKFQICTLKTVLVIASQLQLLHQDENVDGQTNGRADGTQNLYTSASYCRVQLCKVSKLYDQHILSYRVTTKMLTDGRTDGQCDYYRAPAFHAGP